MHQANLEDERPGEPAPVEGRPGIGLATGGNVAVAHDRRPAERRRPGAQRLHQCREPLVLRLPRSGRSSVPSSSMPTEKSLQRSRPQYSDGPACHARRVTGTYWTSAASRRTRKWDDTFIPAIVANAGWAAGSRVLVNSASMKDPPNSPGGRDMPCTTIRSGTQPSGRSSQFGDGTWRASGRSPVAGSMTEPFVFMSPRASATGTILAPREAPIASSGPRRWSSRGPSLQNGRHAVQAAARHCQRIALGCGRAGLGGRGRGKLGSAAEPGWGCWAIPESEIQLLPADMGAMDAIELGCGTGYVSAWMTRRGARVVGIDVSQRQLATARALAASHDLDIRWLQGDAESVPLPNASFDFAISEYGAAIWCDPYAWIPEAHRLLRPGGRLTFLGTAPLALVCTPADGSPTADRLARDYFDLHALDWRGVDAAPAGIEFNLPLSAWLALFRRVGFEVLDYLELRVPAGAVDTPWIPAAWTRRFPAEQVWKLRKT